MTKGAAKRDAAKRDAATPAKDAEKAAAPAAAAEAVVGDETTAAPYRQEPEDRQRDYEGPYFCECCLCCCGAPVPYPGDICRICIRLH